MSLILTYKIFNFREPDKAREFLMDKPTFVRYMNSPGFQTLLAGRTLYGALTHGVRDAFENKPESISNHSDLLINMGEVANAMIGMRVTDNDDVLVDLLVPDMQKGRDAQLLLGMGSKLEVSISIYCDIRDNKYYINKFNGVDFTTDPRFYTELIKQEVVS